jgi:CreA protein
MRKPLIMLCLCCLVGSTLAEEIGSVSTKFKWVSPNDKIVVEVFQDDSIPGIVCYLSRAKTGGFKGAVGVAEDTSDASIDCTQVGPVTLPDDVRAGKRNGEEVFKKRTSLLFKSLQVARFYDGPRNALVYLTYSDRVIEGSPKNSVTAVAIQPWNHESAPPQGQAGQ